MKLAEAAAQWIAAKTELRDVERRVDEAKAVLLEHFRTTGKTSYRNRIAYSTTTYRQLDTTKARQLLGDKAGEAETVRTRETLTAL